jgi:glucans biosynthesis protein C
MQNQIGVSHRQYYLDWLRVLAMAGVFLFHNARFYDVFSDWHVRNAATNIPASIYVAFMSQWMMPLFFLIAGAGAYFALKTRSTGEYAWERVLRLLVPLAIGMLVIVVPQAYYDAVSHGAQLAGYNLWQIYGLYLQTLPQMNWFHLWFLVDLFLFSIITLPLFFHRTRSGNGVIARLARFLDKPWALLPLLVISIAVVNTVIYPDGFWGYKNGGWNIVIYLLFFLFGYLLFANPRIMATIRKMRWISLGTGILTFALICILVFAAGIGDPNAYFGSWSYGLISLVQSLSAWGWILAILAFGSLYLNRDNRFLAYANEAVLPFYVLHQTVIIVIGYYVVQWDAGVGIKYSLISAASFIGIMLIYELLVRRINILRFLFGMKLKKRPNTVVAPGDRVKSINVALEDKS